ncbi:TetR/AcrR family transcriptional regulator [Loktanella sp. R86503]|uniref:TetR/AcrR family transcriptional regulator n=1 Tax=Loktanella sp. R86503 TaxID=3093847 RepID=UPI0036DE7192
MSGLRARKKEATSQRIIAEACRMFQDTGYEETRIEDVAAAAELSVATFYNYFRSKADILLSSVTEETEKVIAQADRCIAQPHADAASGFDALSQVYWTYSFTSTSRQMWRIAVSQTMLDPQSEFCRKYVALDDRLSDQVCSFIRQMQAAGHIRPEVDAGPIGALLFNNVNMNFLAYIRSDTLTAAQVRDAVHAQSAPVFRLIAV